jgi:hypothetical protein
MCMGECLWVCVSVYVYGWVSMCIGECPCVCVSAYVYGWVSMCICVCLCVWLSAYVYGWVSLCMGECLCVWVSFFVYGWVSKYMVECLCVCMSVYEYGWVSMCMYWVSMNMVECLCVWLSVLVYGWVSKCMVECLCVLGRTGNGVGHVSDRIGSLGWCVRQAVISVLDVQFGMWCTFVNSVKSVKRRKRKRRRWSKAKQNTNMGHRVSTGPSPWTSDVSMVNLNPHPPRHCSPYSLELPRLGWAGLPHSVILCSLCSRVLTMSYRMHAFYCAVHISVRDYVRNPVF